MPADYLGSYHCLLAMMITITMFQRACALINPRGNPGPAGIIVMLLLLLCGVKREAIVEDYMMSEKVLKQSRMHNELELDGAPRLIRPCRG